MKRKLTAKQERFAREYVVDHNATQAAIRAGYSAKTAYSSGQRLLSNVEVSNLINEAEREHAKRIQMTADQVLAELTKIAKASNVSSARVRALELLGKYHGLFTERQHVGAENSVVIVIPHNDRETLEATDASGRDRPGSNHG